MFATELLYWARWPLTGQVIVLIAVALPVYAWYQVRGGFVDIGRHVRGALWMIVYLPAVAAVSWAGSARFGGHGYLTWGWDLLVVALIALALPALRDRSLPPIPVWLSASTAITTLVGAYCASRAPHTRALAGVLALVAFAAIAHLGAWVLATRAGDAANIAMFGHGRDLATLGVLLEACAQLFAVMWLGTRGRWGGQLASTLKLSIALSAE